MLSDGPKFAGSWCDNITNLLIQLMILKVIPNVNHNKKKNLLPSCNLASYELLLKLIICFLSGKICFRNLITEMYMWHVRRWKLASSVGMQTSISQIKIYAILKKKISNTVEI